MDALRSVAAKAASVLPSTTHSTAQGQTTSPAKKAHIALPGALASLGLDGSGHGASGATPEGTKTPKTPADEAIEFFSAEAVGSEDPKEVQVWELELEDDGGPSWEKRVSAGRGTETPPG